MVRNARIKLKPTIEEKRARTAFYNRRQIRLPDMRSAHVLVFLAVLSICGCGGDDAEYDPTVIARQPLDQTVQAGQSATFDVLTAGEPPAGYQWFRNQQVIQGATGSSYMTPATTAADNGAQFEVLIYVRAAHRTIPGLRSTPATLTVQ